MTTSTGPCTLDVDLDASWTYGPSEDVRILHGGYLVQKAATAAVEGTEHPHPLSTTTHFLRAPAVGDAQLELTVLRRGRSTSTTRVALNQGGKPVLDVVVTSGLLGAPGTPVWSDGAPPELPPLEDCRRGNVPEGAPRNGIMDNVEIQYDATQTWGVPAGQAEARGWMRFADQREITPLDLLCLADALPPVTFALGLRGWVPTVELTTHVRALPAPGWLRGVQRARLLQDGWLDEECEIWDSTGQLVCQARQLAAFRGA